MKSREMSKEFTFDEDETDKVLHTFEPTGCNMLLPS